jgi:transcriptional regulator with XRE-family HTH domain
MKFARKEVIYLREYLKKLRKDKHLTQQNVADVLGISQNYYHCIENGERQKDLDLSIVMKLSELFGVTFEWIAEQEKAYKS